MSTEKRGNIHSLEYALVDVFVTILRTYYLRINNNWRTIVSLGDRKIKGGKKSILYSFISHLLSSKQNTIRNLILQSCPHEIIAIILCSSLSVSTPPTLPEWEAWMHAGWAPLSHPEQKDEAGEMLTPLVVKIWGNKCLLFPSRPGLRGYKQHFLPSLASNFPGWVWLLPSRPPLHSNAVLRKFPTSPQPQASVAGALPPQSNSDSQASPGGFSWTHYWSCFICRYLKDCADR